MNTPTIETERLSLRAFVRADAVDVFAYASNPNVSRYTTWQTHRTVADSEAFIEMVLTRGPEETTWAIRLFNDPTVIGAIEFSVKSETEAEFHYVLAEPFWNRGLMTEAALAVLAWGLKSYPEIRRISTRAVGENIGSRRVMEKCGLKFAGTHVHAWKKCDTPIEQCEYVLLRAGST